MSVWIESFEQSYEYEGAAALKKAVKAAPEEMRVALMSQLLPSLIDHDRKRKRPTPTLHELRSRFPDLAGLLADAYPLLPANYRLPVELRGYRVLRVVGEGGQAIVLRAQDDMHSAVAIKLSASPQHNELLLRERELLGQCQHPGIPEVIASGVDEDRAFFVMPFLRGMTLTDKYATHRPPAGEATRIATELCGVVDHLHGRGILHRDIKPQNVWLDESGGVKLIDLGMAIDRSSWGSPRAAVAEFHGTPAYMSPEQASADRERDGELSDVFSIGAVLYWMGTGDPPYDDGSQQSVLSRAAAGKIKNDRLRAISNWPRPLVRLCLHAIASEPSQRVASAAELRKRLESKSFSVAAPAATRSAFTAIVVTLLGAAAIVFYAPAAWNYSSLPQRPVDPTGPRPAPLGQVPLRWIDQAAEEAGVDLASMAHEQFTVGVNCRARLVEPWGEQPQNATISPEIVLTFDKSLAPLAPALQYRVGDSAWGELATTKDATELIAPLSMVAAAGHGPVEIRLLSDPDGPPEAAIGPLRYEIDISKALKKDEQAFGRELVKEATASRCFDVSQRGWSVLKRYSRRLSPIIDEFAFSVNRTGPFTPVGKRLLRQELPDGTSKITGVGHDLRQDFAMVAKGIQQAPRLWIKVRLVGGETVGPILYEKSLTEQQERKRRLDAWFGQVEADDELARFTGSRFVLTRLNEVLGDLSHLHFVGRYPNFSTGQPFKVIESSELIVDLNQLPKSRVVELPPVWTGVSVKGRLLGGGFTPSFELLHHETACGCGVAPIASSPGTPKLESYLYMDLDHYPKSEKSLLALVENANLLRAGTVDRCKRSRLLLMSMRPEEAVRVRHYADSNFTKPLDMVRPGKVYARYFNAENEPIGFSVYEMTPALIKEWAEHALYHVADPVDAKRLADQSKAESRQSEARPSPEWSSVPHRNP